MDQQRVQPWEDLRNQILSIRGGASDLGFRVPEVVRLTEQVEIPHERCEEIMQALVKKIAEFPGERWIKLRSTLETARLNVETQLNEQTKQQTAA